MTYLISDETLTAIADAIRDKTSSADKIDPEKMPELIESIKSGSGGINGSCIDNYMPFYPVDAFSDTFASGTTATGVVTEG